MIVRKGMRNERLEQVVGSAKRFLRTVGPTLENIEEAERLITGTLGGQAAEMLRSSV
jgi:hypothetical protein